MWNQNNYFLKTQTGNQILSSIYVWNQIFKSKIRIVIFLQNHPTLVIAPVLINSFLAVLGRRLWPADAPMFGRSRCNKTYKTNRLPSFIARCQCYGVLHSLSLSSLFMLTTGTSILSIHSHGGDLCLLQKLLLQLLQLFKLSSRSHFYGLYNVPTRYPMYES